MGKRDKGIIMLGATTGLRAVDIARLKLTDIDWPRGEIHVSQSKTGSPWNPFPSKGFRSIPAFLQ